MKIDVGTNRKMRKWGPRQQLGRVIWTCVHPFFALSPRPLWFWRSSLLRLFGANIGRGVHVYPTVRITMPWNISLGDQCAVGDRATLYALGTITIGARTTISQGAHICAGTHDIEDPSRPLLTPPIMIGADAWICAEAFIGPNVIVGDCAIVGARAVVFNDVAKDTVVVGNPARQTKGKVFE